MNTDFNPMYEWKDIDWRKVERCVFKLQKRIFKASQQGKVKLVHRLQRLLINSWYGKLMAVRRVSQDNQGNKTAGIDGVKSLTPAQRLTLATNLKLSHKAKPTRRVLIPKPGTNEKRPLGIPTMEERARQALVKQAMEPEWEAKFEPNSYGFRPGRSAHDAIGAIFNAIRYKPKWVLDADIAKCFDKINHKRLLEKLQTYPTSRRQIKAWLKSGVIYGDSWFSTEEGTPQGGVISPLLANIALHGMEEKVKLYAETLKGEKRVNRETLSLIRYADDFVVMHKDEQVINDCSLIISDWLAEMGLELKPSKTKITHTRNGKRDLNFLGFNISQYHVGLHHSGKCKGKTLGFKTLIKPNKEKVKAHIKKLGEVIARHKSAPQEALIKELNPIIRGWSNYFSTVVSKEVFSYCDNILYQQLRRWAKRRHPNKSAQWVTNKYWHSEGNRNWVFGVRYEDSFIKLTCHSDTKIVRHVKVKGMKSTYDGDLTYWSSRMGRHPEMPNEKAALLKQQKGKCNYCGQYFRDGDLMEIDHVIPKALGGSNRRDNKQLLHRHCHDRKTAADLISIRDKNRSIKEPDEVKVSRPVLKTSRTGDCPA
ncbi:group II intron reverse transcriptase/maturase [Roseofilum sp. BLCC_M154]|uniref:Group II intron reverse transcriptase/maturase n=1 Tax=Roseofilum acuticapitatum BLCC-M154 TaxID=3022444 RepID=A0ABT7AMW4_9CYAN|nr:group II intron reverse transcriptase/maturase [Roseofilum acuticapitatum]MDJ1168241.1 group II intron reverse transcriptase/maturase [Roseofilum acuticapitatum BLCC-M154]